MYDTEEGSSPHRESTLTPEEEAFAKEHPIPPEEWNLPPVREYIKRCVAIKNLHDAFEKDYQTGEVGPVLGNRYREARYLLQAALLLLESDANDENADNVQPT